MFTSNVLEAFTEPFNARHYHTNVVFYGVIRFLVAMGVVDVMLVAVFIFNLFKPQVVSLHL